MNNWNTLSKRVATRIEDMIALSTDARLPSQRELSSLFGVSRTSYERPFRFLKLRENYALSQDAEAFGWELPRCDCKQRTRIPCVTRGYSRPSVAKKLSEIGDFTFSLFNRRPIRPAWRRCGLPIARLRNSRRI